MVGFRVDMSPLERSSMNVGQSLVNVGQSVGQSIQRSQQQQQALEEQAQAEALMQQALTGNPESLRQLMVKSPQAAQMVAQYLQQQTTQAQGESDRLKSQMAMDTADFVEQMHLAPQEQQEAMFNSAIDDPRYDIDEEDRQYFMNPNARKALITQVKSKEYADNFFGGGKKLEQGKGIMEGYAFNPDDGTYSINPEFKVILDEAKAAGKLELKDKITLNKEFTNLTKDTKLIRNTAEDLSKLSGMTDSGGNVSGPSSIAMVFKFMKALDPTSVVRESEFATAENSSGVPENVRNAYNKLMDGGKLGPKQVQQFVDTAKGLANSAIDSSTTEINNYLNTFGGDLSASFSKSLINRIPKKFDIKPVESVTLEAVDTPVESVASNIDAQALEWANANPDDPRAKEILTRLGVK